MYTISIRVNFHSYCNFLTRIRSVCLFFELLDSCDLRRKLKKNRYEGGHFLKNLNIHEESKGKLGQPEV